MATNAIRNHGLDCIRYYSPVGKGVTLLKAQASISYAQSDKETYDMELNWAERLAVEYGTRQAAVLRNDVVSIKAAEFWLGQIASDHWHEIIAALRNARDEEMLDV